MGLKNIHLKLKTFKLRLFLEGIGKKKEEKMKKRAPWMNPVTHGFHVVQDRRGSEEFDSDSVIVQREQNGDTELWFFGVFDPLVGNGPNGVTKYLQSHLFNKHPDESAVTRKARDVMRKAHLGVREKIKETLRGDGEWRVGSACALVCNSHILVMANMGGYRAIVCKNGEAHDLDAIKDKQKRHWTRKFFKARMPSLKTLSPSPKSAELVVTTEIVDENTDSIILASTGVWETMSIREAVDLTWRERDPKQAARKLAVEALRRGSRSSIACLIIHVGI